MKPIPIVVAKEIAKKYGYDQVVVYARTPGADGKEHVTTYGTNRMQCEAAGRIGSAIAESVIKPLESRDQKIGELETEIARLNKLLNTPQVVDFIEAMKVEVAHQREKWGEAHDSAKDPANWALLFQYILGKQATAVYDQNWSKYLHHLITLAAICANAHHSLQPTIQKLLDAKSATKG